MPLPSSGQLEEALRFVEGHFHTTMLRNVVAEVLRLVMDEGVAPGEIAILAPFVDDALRFIARRVLCARSPPCVACSPWHC